MVTSPQDLRETDQSPRPSSQTASGASEYQGGVVLGEGLDGGRRPDPGLIVPDLCPAGSRGEMSLGQVVGLGLGPWKAGAGAALASQGFDLSGHLSVRSCALFRVCLMCLSICSICPPGGFEEQACGGIAEMEGWELWHITQ